MKISKIEEKIISLLKEHSPLCTGEIRDIVELDTISTIFLLQEMVRKRLIKDLGARHGDNEYSAI